MRYRVVWGCLYMLTIIVFLERYPSDPTRKRWKAFLSFPLGLNLYKTLPITKSLIPSDSAWRLLRPLTCPSIFKKSVSKTKSEKRPSIFTLNLELSREILDITIKVIPSFWRGNDRKMILDLRSKDQIISAFSEFDLDQDQDHQKWSRSWSYRSLDQIFQRTASFIALKKFCWQKLRQFFWWNAS